MTALLPPDTVEKADCRDRMLLPRAFSPKTWVIVPVARPPSESASSAEQPVGSLFVRLQLL